jgi:hypothetical protein
MNQKSNMHVAGESDGRTVPTKCPNKNGKPLTEGMEGRRPTKENIEQTTASQTHSWVNASSGLSSGVSQPKTESGEARASRRRLVFWGSRTSARKTGTPAASRSIARLSVSDSPENSKQYERSFGGAGTSQWPKSGSG